MVEKQQRFVFNKHNFGRCLSFSKQILVHNYAECSAVVLLIFGGQPPPLSIGSYPKDILRESNKKQKNLVLLSCIKIIGWGGGGGGGGEQKSALPLHCIL